MKTELLSQYDPIEIAKGLAKDEAITYTENGNRKFNATQFLKNIEKIAYKFGVTRLANISHFSPTDFPVYQSTRPNIFGHSGFGQNTGSQGKGISAKQAKISCLMETLETFCFEPRNPFLIQNSFYFLKRSQLVISPNKFRTQALKKKSALSAKQLECEKILWTKAYSLSHKKTVLIPAELSYFPLVTEKYGSKGHFFQATNGLASGSSYLEASIHALYEIIERHYSEFYERNMPELVIEAFFEDRLKIPFINQIIDAEGDRIEIQIFSLRLKSLGRSNLPMIMALLSIDGIVSTGHGCSATIDISISRAVSEALQTYSTISSGSREDLAKNEKEIKTRAHPKFRTLHKTKFRDQVIDKHFKSLKVEFDFIVSWLKKAGFPEIYLINLTRHGIDIPVIKAVVPGLLSEADRFIRSDRWLHHWPESMQFNLDQLK